MQDVKLADTSETKKGEYLKAKINLEQTKRTRISEKCVGGLMTLKRVISLELVY
jgi:hypothetical protein